MYLFNTQWYNTTMPSITALEYFTKLQEQYEKTAMDLEMFFESCTDLITMLERVKLVDTSAEERSLSYEQLQKINKIDFPKLHKSYPFIQTSDAPAKLLQHAKDFHLASRNLKAIL